MATSKTPVASCEWCNKNIYDPFKIVYSKGLWGSLSLGMLGKKFCSERCKTYYQKNKGKK